MRGDKNMGVFETIFRKPKADLKAEGYFKMLNGYTPVFSNAPESIYEMELTRAAIHSFASFASKLKPEISGTAQKNLERTLQFKPNPFMDTSKFIYRIATILSVNNTCFIVPIEDEFGGLIGYYPLLPQRCEVVEYNGAPFLRYTFGSGQKAAIEFERVGVMTQFQYTDDFFGESNAALRPTMQLIHTQNQGIINGVKNSASIDGWILKGDISKYFYSIRHDVLKTLIREKITDPDVLWLIDLIIDSTEGNVGIPIGNQTSQLFALLYLDGLDHFVKEKLGIKYYGRYMDDFFLIHHDKAYLQECRKQIEAFVQARGLSLNAKTNIFPLKHGVDFLGFHTYLTESGAVIRKVRRRSKNNMKRKLKKLAALHAAGRIDAKTVEQSYQSWRGHAEKGNSYHLIRRTDQYYNSLMKSKEAAQCQKH